MPAKKVPTKVKVTIPVLSTADAVKVVGDGVAAELARKLGIRRSAINCWEGRVPTVRVYQLLQLEPTRLKKYVKWIPSPIQHID